MSALKLLALGAMIATPAALSAQTSTPAQASAATAPVAGTPILDSAGVSVGTVDSVTPQAIVINTGTNKVAVPPASIGKTAKGFALSITKDQLMAAQAQAQAQAGATVKAKLVAGTPVTGLNGATLGTIKSADATSVTMTTTKNIDVKLPVTGFGPGANGGVVLGMTQQQLDAATAGATPNATPAPAAATGGTAATAGTAAPTMSTTDPATATSMATNAAATSADASAPAATATDAASAQPAAGTTSTTTTKATTTKKTRRSKR